MRTLVEAGAVVGLMVVLGCQGQPAAAQLGTACNGLATAYMTAAGYRAEGKLSKAQVDSLVAIEAPSRKLCDPSRPPADLNAALSSISTYAAEVAIINGSVK